MKDFFLELKTIKIILKNDIIQLRNYIDNKYPLYDNGKKALILGNTLRTIIEKQLMHIPPQHRQELFQQLSKDTFSTKQDGLFLHDVLEASLSLGIDDDDFLNNLCNWVNSHVSHPIDKNIMIEYKNTLHINEAIDSTNESTTAKVDVKEEIIIESSNDTNQPITTEIPNEVLETYNEPLEITTPVNTVVFHKDIEVNKNKKEEFNDKKNYFLMNLLGKIRPIYIFSTLSICLIGIFIFPLLTNNQEVILAAEVPIVQQHPHLHTSFHYKDINEAKLKDYLDTRNSLLKEEPYFSAIIETAKEFQLNPLVLFAITGHEQGFVPKDNPSASEIANNPFNVFYSWQRYNTDITDSSKIASRTIINLSKDRPDDIDPFQWINRKYAEDQNWWKGVRSIYNRLEKEVK